jgi:hypothetical protein
VALVTFVVPHPSNVDALPVTRNEPREYILVSPFLSFTIASLFVYLDACL